VELRRNLTGWVENFENSVILGLMANPESGEPWIDSEGMIGSGPTYGEHSFNGRPVDEKSHSLPLGEKVRNDLKQKAKELIRKSYEEALHHALFDEDKALARANGMIDMTVELGILNPTEAEELTREYLSERLNIIEVD
jgi:hypothetical protein